MKSQGGAIKAGRIRIAGEFHASPNATAPEETPELSLFRALAAAALIVFFLAGLFYVAHVTALDKGLMRLVDVRKLWDAAAEPALTPCE